MVENIAVSTTNTILLAIVVAITLTTLITTYGMLKQAEEITSKSYIIDLIHEQCNEEQQIQITSQKTLKGKTATLTRQQDGDCIIQIKGGKQDE